MAKTSGGFFAMRIGFVGGGECSRSLYRRYLRVQLDERGDRRIAGRSRRDTADRVGCSNQMKKHPLSRVGVFLYRNQIL